MRVLWLCAEPISRGAAGNASGFWKDALYAALSKHANFEIAVAYPGSSFGILEKGTATFRYPRERGACAIPESTVADLARIIVTLRPDLIHVHGTETLIGQIVDYTRVPVVVSMQGFISECCDAVLGGIPLETWRRFRTIRERLTGGGFLGLQDDWRKSSLGEIRVLSSNRHFIGRTAFDLGVLRKHNATAHYHHGREMLRDVFFRGEWRPDTAVRHRIYAPGFSNPLKGFHLLLEAVSNLRHEFPDIAIATPGRMTRRSQSPIVGNAYHRFLGDRIRELGLRSHVKFLGRLDGGAVHNELIAANVVVVSSLVENSSNALGEALAVGCPAIVPDPCGGLQSLVGDGDAAMAFDTGDARSLARAIRTVFLEAGRATDMSAAAKRRSMELYETKSVLQDYVAIYKEVATA